MDKLIFATTNPGKIREVQAILANEKIKVLSLKEAGIEVEVEENGDTFEENALIKARAIAEQVRDAIVLADDSGLEIDYMNGEPGVHSARYLGKDTSYEYKNQVIIERLKDVAEDKRSARFVCAMAAILPMGKVCVAKGIMEGLIAYEIKGENGFGYDPVFYLPQFQMTAAQISEEQKNEISHRGRALRSMKEQLMPYLEKIDRTEAE